ncbi:MAG: PAS domain S-box protein, partial [Arenimonas sp.]
MKDTVQHRPADPALVGDVEFRLLVDSVTDYAIFLLDVGGFIRTWNAGAKQIKGYEPEEVIGRHVSMFYPEELVAKKWPEHELAVARDCGRFESEGWRIRKDGTRFWASVVITRLLDAQGQFHGYSKITRDVSERRQQEEQLRHSEERFRLLVEGVQDYAIFMLDPSGHVVSWNAAAERTKGYEAPEILGKHFSIFYPEELNTAGWPAEELRQALEHNRFEDEGWRIRKDGSRFWANVVITPLYDARGRHRGFAKVTRDLTDKRRISNLEDKGRRLTDFLAMLGHELRNPLAPISNAVSIIEMADVDSEPVRAARAVISRQLKQMTRLVDDLMDVGRITSGKIHLESKPVNLREAIGEAIEAAEPLVRGKAHSLKLETGNCDPWLQGDKARIVQVVGNLLTNAVKFTPDGGLIVVALRCTDTHAEISVRDTGIGIPHELLVDIFNPFVQGDQDAARSQGGLGLGLSLVREIVLRHRGDVNVYSPALMGRGSEFVVRLPRRESPADAAAVATPADSGARRKILVVDDNQDSADTMR